MSVSRELYPRITFLDGWNDAETDGRWTSAHFSNIGVEIEIRSRPIVVEIGFLSLQEMPVPEVFRVWVGNACMVNEVVTSCEPTYISSYLPEIEGSESLFGLRLYSSFLRLGESHIPLFGDPRRLGIKLLSIVFREE